MPGCGGAPAFIALMGVPTKTLRGAAECGDGPLPCRAAGAGVACTERRSKGSLLIG